MTAKQSLSIISEDILLNKIYEIRGHKVMLDSDLAELYGVETKVFNQSICRNIERFPEDFMFQLTESELEEKKNLFAKCFYRAWSAYNF